MTGRRRGPYARFVRWLAHRRWFAALGRRAAPLDGWIIRVTRGRRTLLGAPPYPTLLLTTTGRRTGERRTTPLMYVRDGPRLVVSSESFGQRRPAGWPLNLDADPRATVELDGRALPCLARRASPGEVERYWPRLVEEWPAHASYLDRSGVRHMFVLEEAQ